jgi:hypothetical protein
MEQCSPEARSYIIENFTEKEVTLNMDVLEDTVME